MGTAFELDPPGQHAFVLAGGQPIAVTDLAAETRFAPSPALLARGVLSGVYTAIHSPDGKALGILGASSRSRRTFAGHDLSFVHAVGNLLATAIDRRRAVDERIVAELETRRASDALVARDAFVSIAAHELRAPLAAVQLNLEALIALPVQDTLAVATRLDRIRHSIGRLIATVETVLDLSRLETGRLALSVEVMSFAEVVDEVVDRFRRDAQRAGCAVKVDVARDLFGAWDRTRLEQVLSNLLSNAFRYAAGSPVEIRAAIAGSHLEVRVSDHGDGIAPEDAVRIFERYQRAARPDRGAGLGVGLFVSREIAEAHGGHLALESRPDAGTTFLLRLPLAAPESAAISVP